MANIEMSDAKRPGDAMATIPRKRFKTSELPLTAAQRGTVDQLLLTFKKRGGFDSLRKEIWAEYGASVGDSVLFCFLMLYVPAG
jgi:hypothetical protein